MGGRDDKDYPDVEDIARGRSVEIRGVGTKPVKVFDSLLTILDVPIRDDLESGKSNVDPLNIHLMDLVSNGVDVNFDLLDEINKKPGEQSVHEDKLIDLRQYVLGTTPNYEMRQETREWLNHLGVNDGLIEDMKMEVPDCFDKLVETKSKKIEKSTDDSDFVQKLEVGQQTIKIEDEVPEGGDLEIGHEEPVKQLVEEKEKTKERVKIIDLRYQKARLHYLGHRNNLIHPDKSGLLIADDNDDFEVGRLRLTEDLLRTTNGEGDLKETRDRLISIGVYVKDLENLAERIKPMFQKREELLQRFYDGGSKDELELLEKEIGEVFGVDIMYERIKIGDRAQPRKEKENMKEVTDSEREQENNKYSRGDFFRDLIKATWANIKEDTDTARERLVSYNIDIDNLYGKLGEASFGVKRNLIMLMDHFSRKKILEEQELQRIEDEILSALGIDNSIFAESNRANETTVKKEEGGVVKTETIENKEKGRYLEYLGGGLIEDLRNIYPPYGVKTDSNLYSRAFSRLESGGKLKRVWTKSTKNGFEGKPVRNFKVGQQTIQILDDYFAMDSGNPKKWDDNIVKEMVVGDYEEFKRDLEEARKRKQEKSKKVEGKGGEKIVVADERSKEAYYLELMKMSSSGPWNLAMKEIQNYGEPQKSYAFGFMKVAYEWITYPERITQNQGGMDRWNGIYKPLLKRLGIKVDE